ncbi:unnamed protein product, partial [Staurois parvus]
MGDHTAPYDKMEPTSSVRRPESGTWQSVRWRQQQWEAVQGPMTHSGPGSSMRSRYGGPSAQLRAWQQHEEAVQGLPWQSGGARQQREQTTEAH